MAGAMKFALKIGRERVKTIEELKNCFDPIEVLEQYKKNATLYRWLKVWDYTEYAQKVEKITATQDDEIIEILADIFDTKIIKKSEVEKLLDAADRFYEKDEFEEAIDALNEALKLEPDNDEIKQKIETCTEEVVQGDNLRGFMTAKESKRKELDNYDIEQHKTEAERIKGITFEILEDETVKITAVDGDLAKFEEDGSFNFPSYIYGLPVSSISSSYYSYNNGPRAFANNNFSWKGKELPKRVTFTFPKELRIIKEIAFYKSPLTEIIIPYGVMQIGISTFSNCAALTSIKLPSSLVMIRESAFSSCGALTSIKLPSSLLVIDKWAFQRCGSLSEILISEGVTSIYEYAFQGCGSLLEVHIPNSVVNLNNPFDSNGSAPYKVSLPKHLAGYNSDRNRFKIRE